MDTVLDYFDSLIEGIAYAAAKQKLRGAAKRTLRRGLLLVMWVVGIIAVFVAIISVAVVSYLMLYWLLVPHVHLEKPVFFNYDTPSQRPEARINLVNRQWSSTNVTAPLYPSQTNLLASGVHYDIELTVRVPDSPRNREISMVMAKLKVESCDGTLLAQSQRPILLEYKGAMARLVYEFVHMIPLAMGWMREEQQHTIRLIDGFQEDSTFYACTAVVEFSKPEFEVYSASVQFSAQLTGIRYAMYYWLFTSGVFGISSILAAESTFVALAIGYFIYLRVRSVQKRQQEKDRDDARRLEGEREGGTASVGSPPVAAKDSAREDMKASPRRQQAVRSGSESSSGDDSEFGRGERNEVSSGDERHQVLAASTSVAAAAAAPEASSGDTTSAPSGSRILVSDPRRVHSQDADIPSASDDTGSAPISSATDGNASSSGATDGNASSASSGDEASAAQRAELRRRARGIGMGDDDD